MRVGIDVTGIDSVAESFDLFGDRYLSRVFTAQEIEDCGYGPLRVERLAARFAAKEAIFKALRPSNFGADWRMIEVRADTNGACRVVLHDEMCDLAVEQGVEEIAVSMSYERSFAAAWAVASFRTAPTPRSTLLRAMRQLFDRRASAGSSDRPNRQIRLNTSLMNLSRI